MRAVAATFILVILAGCATTAIAQKATDTVPPTVRFRAPTENAIVDGSTSIVVLAADDVGVAEVRLHIDDVLVDTMRRMDTRETSSASAEREYAFRLNASSLTPGPRNLRADAVDQSGNVASATLGVTIAGPDVEGQGEAAPRRTPLAIWLPISALAIALVLAGFRRPAP